MDHDQVQSCPAAPAGLGNPDRSCRPICVFLLFGLDPLFLAGFAGFRIELEAGVRLGDCPASLKSRNDRRARRR